MQRHDICATNSITPIFLNRLSSPFLHNIELFQNRNLARSPTSSLHNLNLSSPHFYHLSPTIKIRQKQLSLQIKSFVGYIERVEFPIKRREKIKRREQPKGPVQTSLKYPILHLSPFQRVHVPNMSLDRV